MPTAPSAAELLVCVYYRVGAGDGDRAISAVREFQRTLRRRDGALRAEVLLRCGLPSVSPSPDVPPVPAPPSDSTPAAASAAGGSTDATLMETYRFALCAAPGTPAAQTQVHAFLDELAGASNALAGLLRGARHIELFLPCAS